MLKKKHINITSITKLLTVIVFCKILGYFTLSENISVTRVVKILLRVSTTLGAVFLFINMNKKGVPERFKVSNWWILGLYLFYFFLGGLSLFWSTKPGYSLLQLVMNSESILFCAYFFKYVYTLNYYCKLEDQKIQLSKIFGDAIFVINLLFLIGVIAMPDLFLRLTHGGAEKRLGGYLMNPNELGMLAVIGLACYLSYWKKSSNKKGLFFQFLIVFICLLLTSSRSSMIGFLLILLYHVNQSNNVKLKAGIIISIIASLPLVINTIFLKQGDLEEVMSMTGRLPFWKALFNEGFPKEPWLGYGYMRIAYTDAFHSVHTYAGKMTHNTFIQVLMNLGIVGFVTVFWQLFFTTIKMFQLADKRMKSFAIGLFIPIIINSFTEFGIFGEANYGILFYQVIIFLIVIKERKVLTSIEIRRESVFLEGYEINN